MGRFSWLPAEAGPRRIGGAQRVVRFASVGVDVRRVVPVRRIPARLVDVPASARALRSPAQAHRSGACGCRCPPRAVTRDPSFHGVDELAEPAHRHQVLVHPEAAHRRRVGLVGRTAVRRHRSSSLTCCTSGSTFPPGTSRLVQQLSLLPAPQLVIPAPPGAQLSGAAQAPLVEQICAAEQGSQATPTVPQESFV